MLSLVLTFSSINYATIANTEEVYANDDVTIKVDRIFTDEVNSLSLKLEVLDTEETVSNVSITKDNEVLTQGEASDFYDKVYDNQSVKYEVAYYKEVSETAQSEKETDIITISQEEQTFEFEVIVDELENDLEDISNEEVIVEEVEEKVEEKVEETDVLSTIEENLLTTLSNEVNVSNYGELQAAFKNSAISKINFTDNIIREGNINNKLAPLNRSLEINGNGYYIDFTGAYDEAIVLDRVTTETEFSIRDLQVTGFTDEKQILNEYLIRHKYNTFDPNSKHVWADNWDIKLHNLSTYQNSAQRGIVKASDSKVTITGDLNWKSNSKWTSIITASTSGVLVARDFNITDGARVNITAIKDIFNSSPAKLDSEIKFTVDKGSQLDLYSEDRSTIWVGKEATYNPIKVNITDAGTKIKARANYYGHENADSVIGFTGYGTKVDSYVNITDGAVLDVKSTNTKSFLNGRSAPGIISQIRDGQFNVSGEGTRIDVESLGADDVLGATFRFRIVGNQRLNISDGAVMNVIKVGKLSQAPAMRFWGGGNELFVTSGGKLSVYNEGNGRPQDPGGDARNQGIQYIGSGVSTQFFSVKGAGSAIDIIANYGPAVDIDGLGQSYIEVADEASFVARGNTFSKLGAIFHSLKVEFVTDNPLYYDFANTRVGGGKVFNTTTLSTYESKDSDLAVWKLGMTLMEIHTNHGA